MLRKKLNKELQELIDDCDKKLIEKIEAISNVRVLVYFKYVSDVNNLKSAVKKCTYDLIIIKYVP